MEIDWVINLRFFQDGRLKKIATELKGSGCNGCQIDRFLTCLTWKEESSTIDRGRFGRQTNPVLDHFTEKSFDRKSLTETPSDRNTILPNTIWPNAIWPKVHSTESPFNRRPFDRKFILPKDMTGFFSENGHLTESIFDSKMSFDRKKLRTRSFDRKLI
jgi:hypothetical protein